MSIDPAVRRLHNDLHRLHLATTRVHTAVHTLNTDRAHQPMFSADTFERKIAGDKRAIARDKTDVRNDHRKAMKDLEPAENHLGLNATNHVRHALGLHSVKHVIRNSGKDAIDAAKSVFGRNVQDLKFHGPLAKFLDNAPSSHVCCANFVSACLQKAGLIGRSQHDNTVRGLASNLSHAKNFERVSGHHFQPGDVVCFNVPGEGPMSHVEMFQGYRHGQAIFIGSNNRNADGSQRISNGPSSYGIDAVYRSK